MSIGLLALLDDVAALVKVSAATLDDIPAQVAKTGTKVSGIVIDDTAVTPKYVVGLDPARELGIIINIAKKSMLNKLIILGPAAIILGMLAPWLITPILMLGGGYLCLEGYEKIHAIIAHSDDTPEEDAIEEGTIAPPQSIAQITPEELEEERTDSAVRTDFILSAEIMAITYSTVADKDLVTQIMVMASVAIIITIAVYGTVGLIVKADDLGVHMAKDKHHPFIQKAGRSLVNFMPGFLTVLGYVGTAAMLWVGAEIIIHGIPYLHHLLEDMIHALGTMPFLPWAAKVTSCALFGVVVGWCIAQAVAVISPVFSRFKRQA